MTRLFSRVVAALAAASVPLNCAGEGFDADTEWAVNVGGPAYEASDGTSYLAEASVQGGTVGRIEAIKGSQDSFLYQTYRMGDIRIEHPVANGTYDITFHFAEPETIEREQRVFDAFVEGRRVIDDIDVMLFRDGKVRSALTVTVPGIDITDGALNIHFEASERQPVLSALQVRTKVCRDKSWELIWQDEFDGPGLDAANWTYNIWPPRKVNDEDQAYTARAKNVRVEDGHLVIEAHREDYEGAAYTSGRIHTSGKADFLYGRFEVRARLPRGQGTWPAIWMLPSDPMVYATTCSNDADWQGSDDCDAWPNSGEIDIMEHVGYQMNHIHGTVHTRAYYWRMWEQRKGRIVIDDAADAFHIYAMEWSPERIDVFVDDSLYFSYVNEHNSWREWPFDQPFNLILNVAVGGAWGRAGGPIDDSVFPQRLLVDYARVYRKAASD
jgi:beta-glucanase (GH16 family)